MKADRREFAKGSLWMGAAVAAAGCAAGRGIANAVETDEIEFAELDWLVNCERGVG